MLHCVAVHCRVCVVAAQRVLLDVVALAFNSWRCGRVCVTPVLQHTATHCNTLQHTATHCNTLQHTATHCNTLQHTATHCHTLPHTATHCNTLQCDPSLASLRPQKSPMYYEKSPMYYEKSHNVSGSFHNIQGSFQFLISLLRPYIASRLYRSGLI